VTVATGNRKRDYYEVLGVERNADEVELKRAFRELARKYHPDINPGARAEDRFKEANEAYAVLSDPKARARYDRYGFPGIDGQQQSGTGFSTVVGAFDDLIGDILRRRKQKKRGRDLRYTLEIGFNEAAFGCQKEIRIPDPRHGQGQGQGQATPAPEKVFTVNIPPGAKDGAVRTLRGEGERGKGGAPPGDLCVLIRVAEHPVFQRQGFDVQCEVPVSFPQAALGALIEVPTLDGKVKMRIPEGTQSGRVFRMRGKGVPRTAARTGARGDQLVRILVETPSGLTQKQRQLLEQFAHESGESLAHPQRQGFLAKLRSLFTE
jgi:molecular chaperone DnaJ